MTIVAFALRDQLESNAVDEKELMFKYNQGDGMKSRSDKYSWIKYLVCLKDIISGDIQLYEYITPLFQHPDFLMLLVVQITHVYMDLCIRLF